MSAPWLAIVGIGEDGHLPPTAHAAVAQAGLVVGGRRHLALAAAAIGGEQMAWPHPLQEGVATILARRGTAVAVLASGDPFCFGVGPLLTAGLGPEEWVCHPAASAFTLARARLGWAGAAELSVCGRPVAALVPHLQPGARLLVLSADATSPGAIAALLRAQGFGASAMTVLEAMGGPRERIRRTTAREFALAEVAALNMVAVEVAGHGGLALAPGLADGLFEHDGQLTRREMRALTLSSLAPRQGEILWDVGAGSGSVGIEWMLRHPANRAVCIEREEARAARIRRNAEALGVPGLAVVVGEAPGALTGLEAPDAVFLGGGAHRDGVIAAAWEALPQHGRLVANAVTVQTEAALLAAASRHGGTVLRLALSRLDAVGSMQAFRPAMPLTQWVASKP